MVEYDYKKFFNGESKHMLIQKKTRYKLAMLLFLACHIFTLSCGSSGSFKLKLSASATEIPADGISSAKLIALVTSGGDPVQDGNVVNFQTTSGSFTADSETQQINESTVGGKAMASLYSPDQIGEAQVTASFTDLNGGVMEQTITIKFGQTEPADSSKFTFTCASRNIGALEKKDLKVLCHISAKNSQGQSIKNPQVKFLSEAGRIEVVKPYQPQDPVKYYYIPMPGEPLDVPPLQFESKRSGLGGRIFNPRDGLVSVVAVIRGYETYKDDNGNGKHDDTELFTDTTEPFVDSDDNMQWDQGEEFLDINGNGIWDRGNGKWDADTMVSRTFKIMWTGKIHKSSQTSRFLSAEKMPSFKVPYHQQTNLLLYVMDENMNPLAFNNPTSDYINLETVGGGELPAGNDITLQNCLGMKLASSKYGDDGSVLGEESKDCTFFSVSLRDDDTGEHEDVNVTVKGDINYTPAPDDQENSYQQLSTQLPPISGQIMGQEVTP